MTDELSAVVPGRSTDGALPTGTVTFLFTDIVGSTGLLRQDRQAYGRALDVHRRLLRAAFAACGGHEVDTQGDSFFAAFSTAEQGLAAAAQAQRSLAAQSWPDGMPMLVRMGLHTGEATVAGDGYLGLPVHRAARIAAAAAGGQVLVSEATAALAGEDLPAGTSLRPLGEHRLKDFPHPAALYQLDVAGLPADFPPPRTLAPRWALPGSTGELLGREADLAALAALLTGPRTRLVTLIGPGGIGKTRLAIETAQTVSDAFPGGVAFVALSAVADPHLVLGTIADALGAHREPGVAPLDVVRSALGDERTLLVLDNVEQVVAARSDVAALLEVAPRVLVLATSRQAMRLRSERQYPLPPLARTPAQQLFAERAAAVSPGFALDDGNADVVAEICRRLDGLPLAIELAAARVRLLPPAALLGRLGQRLDVLGGGPLDLPERQRTLRATMDWSFDLLGPHEQAVFIRLGVFAGGWSLAAAEAVCGGGPDEPGVLESLTALLDASLLLEFDQSAPEPRLHMLETVQTYAQEKLAASADRAGIEERHRAWVLAMTESFWHARDRGFSDALERFDRERANLRAAVQRAIEAGDVDSATLILRNTFPYLLRRDAEREAMAWMEQLEPGTSEAGDAVRGRLLVLRALFAGMVGDLTVVRPLLAEGRRILPDDDASDRALVATAGTFAAMAEGSVEGLAYAAILRADLALVVGDLESAEAQLRVTQDLFDARGEEDLLGPVLSVAGLVLLARGDVRAGRRAVLDGAAANRRGGHPTGIAYSLEGLAAVALAEGRPAAAARALAASSAARRDIASPLWPILTPLVDDLAARARTQSGDQAEAAVAEGTGSDPRQVLDLTLAEIADLSPS